MDLAVRIPTHQLRLVALEQSVDEMKRAELQVVDDERTIRATVEKKQDTLSVIEGRRAEDVARNVDLREESGVAFDRLLDRDLGDGLALHMRPQHASDDHRAGALDLEAVRGHDVRDRAQSRGDENDNEQRNEPE